MSELGGLQEVAPGALDRFRLDDKVALVVGGTRGIGAAMALGLASAGADVCVASRGPAGLHEVAAAVTALGRQGASFALDATDEAQVERLVAFMLKTYGRIDTLINCQGAVALQPTVDLDLEPWQRVMDVNVKSLVLTCKHVGRVMLQQGKGSIINVSSVRGFQGRAEDVAYAPSKAAVNNLTHSLAIEWGTRGIRVNGIAPAFTRTALAAPFLDDPANREWVLSRIPMKRVGELVDFMGPAIFLASDASSFVNGHVLMVDGGWMAA
jgi:NAD(P)-dependent dehydrogenase (short-subunit alcohol dehydrogenase family)